MNKIRFLLVFLCILLLTAMLPTPTFAAANVGALKQATPIIETLSSGYNFTCWLKSEETIRCWGDNTYGKSTPPTGTFKQISAGGNSACALKTDDTLICWGDNTGYPAGTFTQVSNASTHGCAVQTDGMVACWGTNDYGESTPPNGTFTQVSAGTYHTCGVETDGSVACWGYNNYGQATPAAGTFSQVIAGPFFTCGIHLDGTLACWGWNEYGQASPPAGTFVQISTSGLSSCGLKSDSTIVCWGGNNGFGESSPPAGTFNQISRGSYFGCGINTDNILMCWGDNTSGQLDAITISGNAGMPSIVVDYTNGSPKDGNGRKSVVADTNGNYAIHVQYNWSGIVVLSDIFYSSPDPVNLFPASRTYTNLTTDQTDQNAIRGVLIAGNVAVGQAAISYIDGTPKSVLADAGGNYSFVVPYLWSGTITPAFPDFRFKPASKTYDQLSDNRSHENFQATSSVAFAKVSAGNNHSCLLNTNGEISCWGNDNFGQAKPPAGTFIEISAGKNFNCAIRTTGALACWGYDFYHQTIPPAGTFTDVAAGDFHACAIRTSGTVVCWGNNQYKESSPTPSGKFTRISAGMYSSCGQRIDNTIECWGNIYDTPPANETFIDLDLNNNGCAIRTDNRIACWPQYQIYPSTILATQIGVGTGFECAIKMDSTVACWGNQENHVKSPTGTFLQISAGSAHACGIRVGGNVFCWGNNHYGQLEPSKLSFQPDIDGFILESDENSGKGDTFDELGRALSLGDDSANRQYRAILSFPTQMLPDRLAIKTATLKLMKMAKIVGVNPFDVLGNLLIDIRTGPFSGQPAVQASDFSAPASATKVGIFDRTPVANWFTAVLNKTGLSKINKTGLTQLRLYFSRDDNNDLATNLINFYSGNAGEVNVNPILIIERVIP